jgi:23S rRNA pseudouridine955/2504/2580 synthase
VKNIIGAAQGPSAPAAQFVEIGPDAEGQRLDNYLLRVLKGVPKTHVYRIIRSGEVRVNKGRAEAATRLALGDSVRLPPLRLSERAEEKADAMARSTPARSFPVLYEDEAFLAIDKPAGVAVHGGSGVDFGVIEQLRMARPGAPMLELVHRLDRETSGVLLVAKKRSALRQLQDQFRERETGKTYLALALGQWPARRKVLDKPLVRYLLPGKPGTEGERRVRIAAADDPQGMRSITLVRVAETFADYSLLEVTIKTGRTHQIRVHLARGPCNRGRRQVRRFRTEQGAGPPGALAHVPARLAAAAHAPSQWRDGAAGGGIAAGADRFPGCLPAGCHGPGVTIAACKPDALT